MAVLYLRRSQPPAVPLAPHQKWPLKQLSHRLGAPVLVACNLCEAHVQEETAGGKWGVIGGENTEAVGRKCGLGCLEQR